MKTKFRNQVKLFTATVTCSFVLASVLQSPCEQLKQMSKPPQSGTFWLLSFEIDEGQSPPFPFDPYAGLLPIYEMKGFPEQYVVADSPEDYRQYQQVMKSHRFLDLTMSTLESGGPPAPGDGGGGGGDGGGATYSSILYTNAPETLLFDTMGSSSNGVLASWRDVRPSPVPEGMALGVLIQTNFPFEITRIETEVLFENPEALPDTEFEVGFFRNTNQFAMGMYVEPEYIASDVRGTLSKTLADIGGGRWLLSVELPTYAWGTNRIVTVRTIPRSNGAMAKMSMIACSATVPGIIAYSSDNTTTNMAQVSLPRIRVWRRELSAVRSVAYETFMTGFEVTALPGYQLGSTTNLALPMDWQTDELGYWHAIVDARDGMRFFLMRPDPTE